VGAPVRLGTVRVEGGWVSAWGGELGVASRLQGALLKGPHAAALPNAL